MFVRHYCDKIEIWKPALSSFLRCYYPNYLISNFGQVQNANSLKNLKHNVTKSGYSCANLYSQGKARRILIHRLVCDIFNGSPHSETHTWVHHKNHIKSDVRAINLEWVSHSENQKKRHEHWAEARKLGIVIFQWTEDGSFYKKHDSIECARKELKISSHTLRKMCRTGILYKGFYLSYDPNQYTAFDGEIWKNCILQKKWEVSNFGRVRNKHNQYILRSHSRGGWLLISPVPRT